MWTLADMGTHKGGIAGVEISGGCSARLQEYDGYQFTEVLLPGFTALKGREERVEYDYEWFGEVTKIAHTYDMRDANRIDLFCPRM